MRGLARWPDDGSVDLLRGVAARIRESLGDKSLDLNGLERDGDDNERAVRAIPRVQTTCNTMVYTLLRYYRRLRIVDFLKR